MSSIISDFFKHCKPESTETEKQGFKKHNFNHKEYR